MKKTATLKEIGRRLAISLYEAVFPSTCSICLKLIDVSKKDEKEIQLKYSQTARGEADFGYRALPIVSVEFRMATMQIFMAMSCQSFYDSDIPVFSGACRQSRTLQTTMVSSSSIL